MKSIKNKFLFYFIFPLVVIGLSFFAVSGIMLKKNFIDYAQNESLLNARRIGLRLQDGLINKNVKALTSIIFEEKNANRGIAYAEVFDENGEKMANTFLSEAVGKNVSTENVDFSKNKESFFFQDTSGGRFLIVDEPLVIGIRKIGTVRLQFDFSDIESDFANANFIFIGLGLAFLQLAVFFAIRFSYSILRPLKQLTEIAGEYAKGNFDKKNKLKTADEIGTLARALDLMADNVCTYNEDIAREKKTVAEKVSELEKWQHSTMERELKMIELKKQIAELQENCKLSEK